MQADATMAKTSANAAPFSNKFGQYCPFILVAAAVFAYIALAAWRINQPGLYYDECLFINAALGAPDNNTFVFQRVCDLPVMCMPYIGALKSLIFAPLFLAFGMSVETIRLPVVAISGATLVLAYLLVRRFLPAWIAGLFAVFLAVDPSFVLQTRVDWGPIVLMCFLKLGAIYCLIRSLQTSSWRQFSLALMLLALGVYDKLNFVWVVLALFPATLVYSRSLWTLARAHPKPIAVSTVLLVAVIGFFFFQLICPLLQSHSHPVDLITRFSSVRHLYLDTFSGNAFYSWVFGKRLPHHANSLVLSLPVLLGSLLACAILKVQTRYREEHKKIIQAFAFFAILSTMLAMQLIITEQATGPHHMMILWPFHYIVLLLSAYLIIRAFPKSSRALTVVACLGAVSWCGINTMATLDFYSACSKYKMRCRFSPLIYDLSAYLQDHSESADHIVFVDWGLSTQVSALLDSASRKKCADLWHYFYPNHPAWFNVPHTSDQPRASQVIDTYFCPRKSLAIEFAPGKEVFPQTRIAFSEFVRHAGLQSKRTKTFYDGDEPVYEIYEISHIER